MVITKHISAYDQYRGKEFLFWSLSFFAQLAKEKTPRATERLILIMVVTSPCLMTLIFVYLYIQSIIELIDSV